MEKFSEHPEELKDLNYTSLKKLKEKKVEWTLETPYKHRIVLLKEDLVNLVVDAIVNSAQETLTGGGGVDEAIHLRAGPGLNKEIEKTVPIRPNGARCMTGEAVLTKGHKLPAKYILHTVAPYLDEKGGLQPRLLRNCYKSCLKLAEEKDLGSIAFPPLGTGFYGYPMLDACEVAFEECYKWMSEKKGMKPKIFMCFISELQHQIASELYQNYVKESPKI